MPRIKWRSSLLALALACGGALAGEAQIAVAANFAVPGRQLAEEFSRTSGHRLRLSSGSTGKLYAQIRTGAPFDVLLSADEATPRRLEADKLADPRSRFTYAIGRLALWRPKPGQVDESSLRSRSLRRLAIANPRLAPYGVAARETLEKLGLWNNLQPTLVQGESIAQAFQFVASGNAELGFVALSQLQEPGKAAAGSYWLVPEQFHAPLRQDAVLLARGIGNGAASDFLAYLKTAPARERIRAHGYRLDEQP